MLRVCSFDYRPKHMLTHTAPARTHHTNFLRHRLSSFQQ